jgi:rubrerythrin
MAHRKKLKVKSTKNKTIRAHSRPRIKKESTAVKRKREKNFGLIASIRNRLINSVRAVEISNETLLDFLSEFLTVEKGGIELYSTAFSRSTDPEIKEMYKNFLSQTKNHARLLTDTIERLGGDPSYMSPGAIGQKAMAKTMLSQEFPPELRELKDAENLLIAETKDHMDWEFLKKIASSVQDEAKNLLYEMVGQIESEEEEHLSFAKKAVEKLSLRAAKSRPTPVQQGELRAA